MHSSVSLCPHCDLPTYSNLGHHRCRSHPNHSSALQLQPPKRPERTTEVPRTMHLVHNRQQPILTVNRVVHRIILHRGDMRAQRVPFQRRPTVAGDGLDLSVSSLSYEHLSRHLPVLWPGEFDDTHASRIEPTCGSSTHPYFVPYPHRA